jgi:methyltransferase (TIGR00027 family)
MRLSCAAFYAINTVFAPVTAAGYALWLASAYRHRASGVSTTAQGPLFARWLMHELGTRRDEAAHRLLPLLPGQNVVTLRMMIGPIVIAHRATGYVPPAFRYPYEGPVARQHEASARQTFFDRVVERRAAEVDQIVVLGAGFDTRAFRLPGSARVRAFEVDMPVVQALKRELLARAGVDTGAVTFVAADFEHDDWLRRLAEAGFERARKALFLWEGVAMYLERGAVEATLRAIAGTRAGSVVAFDYFTTEALESRELYWRYARATTRIAHEPLVFGVDATPSSRDRVANLLESCGLQLTEHQTLGEEDPGRHAWGGFATAVVP